MSLSLESQQNWCTYLHHICTRIKLVCTFLKLCHQWIFISWCCYFPENSYLNSVGAALLEKVLGLESECLKCFGPKLSTVFVIDYTGSMGDDIRSVITAAIELVTKSEVTPNYQPFNYILVTFNDPGIYNLIL